MSVALMESPFTIPVITGLTAGLFAPYGRETLLPAAGTAVTDSGAGLTTWGSAGELLAASVPFPAYLAVIE